MQQHALEEIERFLCSYSDNESIIATLKWFKIPRVEMLKLIKTKRNDLLRSHSDPLHVAAQAMRLLNVFQVV